MALQAGQARIDGELIGASGTAARFVEYRRTRSRTLRNRLVEDHLDLVDHFVRRFRRRGVADDDLRQVCLVALLHATERYDPSLGVGFPTFASRTMEGEVKRYLRDRTWAVRPPRRAQELFLEVRRAEDDLAQELRRPATVAQIADRLGESSDRVLEALEAGGAHRAVSLDAPRPGTASDGEREPLVLGEQDTAYDQIEMREVVTGLLDQLSSRDRAIVEMRFFANMSQPQIAEQIGVSQSYLSRLLRSILLELRHGCGFDL